MPEPSRRLLGIVGAGTMGTGIAEVAAVAGFPVRLQDIGAAVLTRSRRRMEEALQRSVARGRLQAAAAEEALGSVTWVDTLEELREADLIIEAAPEDLTLKRELFRRLDDCCTVARVLASNTSSLSISAMAAATRRPDRVVGLHFFNPVPAMALVEVIRGMHTSEATEESAAEFARALGKTPVRVAEAPGFLVNRVARPFTSEAIRILSEGLAAVENIDRVMREAGGFRMGPFELIDLIGVDVNLAASRAIYEAFFHDPRYQPHPLQQRMVDAGLLGRKSGRGFYQYDGRGTPASPPPGRRDLAAGHPAGVTAIGAQPDSAAPGLTVVIGRGRVADDLLRTLRAAGIAATETAQPGPAAGEAVVAIDASMAIGEEKAGTVRAIDTHLPKHALLLTLTLTSTVTEAAGRAGHPERIVGFATLPPLADRPLIEIQTGMRTSAAAAERAATFWTSIGKRVVDVGDGVAGVFPRIQAMLSHEAIVALAAQIASADEIDTAMRLGVNYPQGPIERAEASGFDVLLATVEGLQAEYGDPRYRPSPLLRRWVAAGRHKAGAPPRD
jgi:3-hydroxybutyryl-CoA dehydrogenase